MHRVVSFVAMLTMVTILTAGQALARSPRVVNDADTVSLHGNVHPRACAEFDMGSTDQNLPLKRMSLALRIPADKQAALDQFNADLQNPASPHYHKWLTPAAFAMQFGPSAEDVQAVTGWLTAHGFTVEEVAAGRTWINFSGTAAMVNRAFKTTIHDYYVNGKVHHANAVNPSIPRGLSDLVAGPVSLNSFPRKPMNNGIKALAPGTLQPNYTSGSSHYLAPADFVAIYNVKDLYSAGIDGTGQSIAIAGRTHPSSTNWSTFRSKMGLSANPPQVIVNGTDPGDLGSDENGEADLDVEWSGAVAKGATIKFVISKSTYTTDGIDLSAQYIVNNNLAPVMSVSFGQCEANMGSAENTFYKNLWAQAAAQGITVFVSSGDSGIAGCDGGSATMGSGAAVNGLASTPYNVAVGGTQFNEGSGSYWNTANGTGYGSATGYIPEVAWNESGSVSGGSGLWATGGGVSSIYAKPTWQAAPGVPADGRRDLPDVALSAAGHDAYLVQTQGALYAISGTSASSPSFAGLMALVVQKTGQRQGNANGRLYQLAQAQYSGSGPVVFHDTTSGNNSVPGVPGDMCGAGYDLVTGLGSVDASALAANWSVSAVADFSLSASPTSVSAVQGAAAGVTIKTAAVNGFSSAIALSVTGLPTGATASFSPASIAAPGTGSAVLTLGTSSTTPTGSYPVTVKATGGTVTHSTSVVLMVTAAPVPSFTLSAAPTAVSAVQGSSATTTLTTTVSGGFNSSVALAITGLPSGATAAFAPATIAAPGNGSAVLTLSTATSTAAGTYTVTVTGSGGGVSKSTTISFTVASAAATGTLFSDGFEGSGWYATALLGTGGKWSILTSGGYPTAAPHAGSRMADFNSYTAASGSQTRLYRSTGFAVPSTATAVTLRFWMYHDKGYSTRNDRIQPQVSTDGTTWANVGPAISRYNGTTGWAQSSVDLTAYRGKTVRLGFVGIGAYGNDMYLDDVGVVVK